MRASHHPHCWRVSLGLVVALALGGPAFSQSASEAELKAAFLLNFARFTEWPPESPAPDGTRVLCVLGDEAVAESLDRIKRNHPPAASGLLVRRTKADGPIRSCHLLYVSNMDARALTDLLTALQGAPVLTVGDRDVFTRLGGAVSFFEEDGRMRFAINVDAVDRARLHLSSKLLILAKIIKDDRDGIHN